MDIMTNSQSKQAQKGQGFNHKVTEQIQHHVRSFPPPICFAKSKRGKEKKESSRDATPAKESQGDTPNGSHIKQKATATFLGHG